MPDVLRAISFDAMGTLIRLRRSVGENYVAVGEHIGLKLDPVQLDRAFYETWCSTAQRPAIDGPRDNDDKGWWRTLVFKLLEKAAPHLTDLDRDNFFEVAYQHFAEPDVWELERGVLDMLMTLQPRFQLVVISNFDGRLRFILEHLGIGRFFDYLCLSSELGADKPDPEIFRRALLLMNLQPAEVLHVGDDPERDWRAAESVGVQVFRLTPQNTLRHLVKLLA